MKRTAFLILTLLAWCPALGAKTIDLDSATIADIDDAFKAGTLTSERLVQLCLARIRGYDREGPSLHAVMILNPKAIETARELDAERKAKDLAPRFTAFPWYSRTITIRPICLPPAAPSCSKARFLPPTRFW